MLRDPNVETRDIAAAAGVPREEAGLAARLVAGIQRAKPEEAVALAAPLALAVARAALAAGRAELLAALAAHPEKGVAKEARRGLHLLRSRGVAAPPPLRPATAPPPPAPEPALPCWASAIDGAGERAVWISRNVPGRGIEVSQAVLSDERGLVDLQTAVVGRKEWRGIAAGLLAEGGAMGVAEIEPGRARALVAAARALNDASGARVPEGADLWIERLGPAAPLPDPAEGFPPLPGEEERAALAASGTLHDLPILRGWMAEEPFLREVAGKLDEAAVSPLYLDEAQRAGQMTRILADAAESLLDEGRRRLLAGRLFAVADHLERAGDPAHARAAAAAARALRAGKPAAEIPFARLLVEKAFPPAGPSPAPPGEDAPPPSPLVVPPR